MFNPRPGQAEVLRYAGGKMGISAVPGSGKTHTLSALAALLVSSRDLGEDQEVLIVTLVNSAVDNFASRVAGFLRDSGLIPGIGYRVRTLHGLAYDIVREQPSLVGLDNQFSIADERTSMDILNISVTNWVRTHPEFMNAYADPNYPPEKNMANWTQSLNSLAGNFIKQAKDYQITPEILYVMMEKNKGSDALLEYCYQTYLDYQRALVNRGAVDFEDLIRLAYFMLINQPDYLERLHRRWPLILEDEAQDSSLIQEKLLRLLCGDNGNWVRVGDPNQAIFETFTTADPRLLREFILQDDVVPVDLEHSGRSTISIIHLANQLISWARNDHPVLELRDTLSEPFIKPTPPGDAQPNPVDEPLEIYLVSTPFKADEEIRIVAGSIKKWISENPDLTAAVLVPRNMRGTELAEELIRCDVPIREMLNSSQETRDTARKLKKILDFYTLPSSTRHFTEAIMAVCDSLNASGHKIILSKESINTIRQTKRIEEILVQPENWVVQVRDQVSNDEIASIRNALELLYKWQRATLLPVDQMIMTISMDLFTESAELALAHKLSVILKNASSLHLEWELPDFIRDLDEIVRNRFRLYGFSEDDLGFNPDDHPGEVVISTIHKAKGLEWDRVYLMSVNNYDFPSLQPDDRYISEKWFIQDHLNLEAEAIARLDALVHQDPVGLGIQEGAAGHEARMDYCAERLRLLYVGVTRARRQLVITWNTGRQGDCTEALPLQALRHWREENYAIG